MLVLPWVYMLVGYKFCCSFFVWISATVIVDTDLNSMDSVGSIYLLATCFQCNWIWVMFDLLILPAPLRWWTDQIFTAELFSLRSSTDGIFMAITVTEMMLTWFIQAKLILELNISAASWCGSLTWWLHDALWSCTDSLRYAGLWATFTTGWNE